MANAMNDDELLAAVAQRRDRQAFAEFYARHQHDAYNLAMHVTGRKELAEDTVQEALVTVWKAAGNYMPGNARGWLLRIVANAGLRILRTQRRNKAMDNKGVLEDAPVAAVSPAQNAEHTEMLGILRKGLRVLPEISRQLVVLYYAAGMTQEEIGRSLDMPTRTVSFKIKEALDELRSSLARAGYTMAIPMVGADILRQAICEGAQAPAGLSERILSQLTRVSQVSRHSRRAVTASKQGTWIVVVTLFAAMGCGALYFASQAGTNSTAGAAVVPPPPAPDPQAAPSPSVAQSEWIHAKYTFESGPEPSLKVLQGRWEWKNAGDGRMVIPGSPEEIPTVVQLPQHFSGRPLRFDFTVQGIRQSYMGLECRWNKDGRFMPMQRYNLICPITTSANKITIYVFDEYVLGRTNGKTNLIQRYRSPYPGDRLCLVITNWAIQDFEFRELRPEEFSAIGLDAKAEIERMERAADGTVKSEPEVIYGE